MSNHRLDAAWALALVAVTLYLAVTPTALRATAITTWPPTRTLFVPPDRPTASFAALTTAAGLAIGGHVLTGDGAPIADAVVWTQAATGEVFTTTSAVDGAFVVSDLITGTYVLTATAATHYFRHTVADLVVPPSHTDIVLIGAPYATIGGFVRSNTGAPLAGVTITAERTPMGVAVQTSTDAQGAYTLTHLSAGPYQITPNRDLIRFTPPTRTLETPPDASGVDFMGEPHYALYLPLLHRPPADLTIRHIEVTQATQTETNHVPLVAERPTLARVYAMTNDWENVAGVFLELSATRNGQFLGAVRQGPGFVRPSPARERYETTYNVRLPAAWLAQDVELSARIDPDNDYAELDESNNEYRLTLFFQPVPPLQVKFVPINYTHLPTGAYFPGEWDERELDFLRQVFPVSQVGVTVRAPLNFSGDLTRPEQWSPLLAAIAELKLADGAAASQVYYGLIPIRATDGVHVAYGGMGFLSFRAAIGLVSQPQTTAHEIGHNLGLRHAPCGNPAYVDPGYPYVDAQIGEYGVDVAGDRLISATGYKDLMGYCGPRWISDYHYLMLLQDQQQQGRFRIEPPRDGRLIRMRFTATGAELLPIYPLHAPLSAADDDSPYRVEFLDARGVVLATYPVQLLTAEEGALSLQMIAAVTPAPPAAATHVQVTAQGALLAARRLAPASSPTVYTRSAGGRLAWQAGDQPALVRYSADEGETWTTLAIDLRGGVLDAPHNLDADTLLWEVVVGE